MEAKKQLVIGLCEADYQSFERLVEARRRARPDGARHLSSAEVIRQLIREAVSPAEMTDDENQR